MISGKFHARDEIKLFLTDVDDWLKLVSKLQKRGN